MTRDVAAAVLNAGGNLKINVSTREAMVFLAALANQRGVQVTFKGGTTMETMLAVVNAGGSNVTFDSSTP